MLVRAARRKASTHLPRPAPSTDLYLPWLCPALQNQNAQLRRNSGDANRHGLGIGKRRDSKDGLALHHRRSLATHTTAASHNLDDIPYDFETSPGISYPPPPPLPPSSYQAPRLSVTDWLPLRPLDPHDTLSIHSPIVHRKKYRFHDGTGGDVSEMYSVLQGCLCVGRLKRAEAIINRLQLLQAVSLDELTEIHQEFLRVWVERIVANPDDSSTQSLHRWFEMNVRRRYDFDYIILAYMLKASLREPNARKRNRLVQRYMDLLPPDITRDVQKEFGVLNEKELELIQKILEKARCIQISLDEEAEQKDDTNGSATSTVTTTTENQDIPLIQPTAQKGLGLKALKQTLDSFSEGALGFDPSLLTYEQRRERQTRIEESAVRSAIERWREENAKLTKIGMNTALQTKSVGARMWKWQLALEEYIKLELQKIDAKVDAFEEDGTNTGLSEEQLNLSVWLRFVPHAQLAAIAILTTMGRLASTGIDRGVPTTQLIMQLGKAVEEESMVQQFSEATKANPSPENKRKTGFLIKSIKWQYAQARDWAQNPPDQTENRTDLGFRSMISNYNPWTMATKAHVGAFLLAGLTKIATLPVTRVHPETGEHMTQVQPAFSHTQQYKMGKKVGIILTNSTLVEQLKREPVHSLLASHLPMVVEPAPWTKFNAGGFIAHPTKAIRIKHGDKDQRNYAEAAVARGDLDQVFKGLDVLGKQSWRINKSVFNTLLEGWNTGEAIANIPAANPELPMPVKPAADAHPDERRKYIRAVKSVENARSAFHSQRCFQNFQLEIARTLRDEVFYFPHNVDFRGRAYPIPPLLNHMGADHCRGLLLFGEARALGKSGLRWLKIHLANVYGFDKASLSERERFAEQHLDDIYDSATKPLEGKRWWLESDDPWQTLAACIELKNALDSPDPTKYMSSLPVHQDGTCNGLQHYAALGGDEWGARQVNLEPADKPADVYTAVADLVVESMAKDLANGNRLAKVLEGKINRKVVKQTVMTNVYGVTFVGAKAQVRKQLVSAHKDLPTDDDFHVGHLAAYIAAKIFEALGSMFGGAHEIQYWFGECASRISASITPDQMEYFMQEFEKLKLCSKSGAKYDNSQGENLLQFKSSVVWTTPLHMPVVQPYRVSKARLIKTSLQQVSLTEPHRSDPVSRKKQLQGFPPNFIHSLDATHMMLSALQCYDLGLSFAAVHDSFWTHASDVDTMNSVLRDAFIKIHSEDVVGRLAAEFKVRYKGSYQLVRIKPGSPIINKLTSLRKSKEYKELRAELLGGYTGIASKLGLGDERRADELIVELKVAEMLRSDDPEIVARAKNMQTPGRLFSEMAEQGDFERPAELTDAGIGEIPAHEASLQEVEKLSDSSMAKAKPFENPVSDEGFADVAQSESQDEELSDAVAVESEENNWEDQFTKAILGKALRKKGTPSTISAVWVPLKFPPVPKRGDFDVTRLKESQYFFS